MEELIRWIRDCAGLSQTELGKTISADFTTINRWENGHSVPNKSAQEKLFQLCERENVPLYEHVVQRIKDKSDGNALYHGSKSGINGKIIPSSRNCCDFGQGFYMGNIPEQPISLINDYKNSKLYILTIDDKKLKTKEITDDLDWALFVAMNRNVFDADQYPAITEKYSSWKNENDVLVGNIADDRLFIAMDYFFNGMITDVGLVECLKAMKLGKQYVAMTQKACDCITVKCTVELSDLERMAIRTKHVKARTAAQKFVDDTLKANRRNGRFIDEILEEWK